MYSHTIAVLEKFDNQHDFERMAADILNSSGYKKVVPIAPRGGSDGGMDITFNTDDGKRGLACVTLRKDIDIKFKEDFSKRSAGEFDLYILFCTAYLTASQKSQFAQYCLDTLQAELLPHDIEALRSLLDSTLQQTREKYLHIKSEPEKIVAKIEVGGEAAQGISGSNKIRSSNRIERLYLIEKLLQQHAKLRTSELAKKLGVNDDTIRHDLNFLSATGRLPLIKEGWYWKIVQVPVDEKDFSLKIVKQYDYDVALSYASEDRNYVDALATLLQREGVKVFYDKYEKASLWGEDLYTYLSDIYQNKARYCVMFLSQHYAAKLWTNHERQAAQARAFNEQSTYILPLRLDNTVIPGILPTTAYLTWSQETVEDIVRAILEKLEDFSPKSLQQWYDECSDYLSNGYNEKALIACHKAMRIDPYDWNSYYQMGYILNQLERYEEALAYIERGISLGALNDDDIIYDVQCDALIGLERYEEALIIYEARITREKPYMHTSSYYVNKYINLIYGEANALFELRRFDEAFTLYDEAIQLAPTKELSYQHKAYRLYLLGRYEEALMVCELAIKLAPKDEYTYGVKGDTLQELERYEEALAAYEKVIQLKPEAAYAAQEKEKLLKLLSQNIEK